MAIMIAAGGCGKADVKVVTVIPPTRAIYDGLAKCEPNPNRPHWVCPPHFDLRRLLGLSLTAAMERAREHALKIRVVERDGHGLIVDRDELSNRVDVAVGDGIVTAIREVG